MRLPSRALAALLAFQAQAGEPGLEVVLLGRYSTGIVDTAAAEISAYDPVSKRMFTTSADAQRLDIVDLSNPRAPRLVKSLDFRGESTGPTSVTTSRGRIAVALPGPAKTAPGSVLFVDAEGNRLAKVAVGALPDMVRFTPDGNTVLAALEGEPDDYCAPGRDPEGGIAVIDVSRGPEHATARIAGFGAFAAADVPGLRLTGPGASLAQDVEPEFIAVSDDGRTAWATLQENNALAVIDVAAAKVTRIVPLGEKDHSRPGMGLDASDVDGGIRIRPWPVWGQYQPDVIRAATIGGRTWLFTANEGEGRDWECGLETITVGELKLDAAAFPDAAELQKPENLGRLKVDRTRGDTDGDGDHDQLHSFGARSFSVWDADGALVWDSGDQIEQALSRELPALFNADNTGGVRDSRSDDKGPEPEGLASGVVGGRHYVFVGLERASAIVAIDVTDPTRPRFVRLFHGRDLVHGGGDLGPEGLWFVDAADSPTGEALLLVSNELSGTVGIWELRARP
jgi:hypothetical protein